ncbi:MAG: hypothetical protein AABY15_00400 [Nanoarchaeota archaeon]
MKKSKFEYVILYKLADGRYEVYKTPFPTKKKAVEKIKEFNLERINTAKKWFSKVRSNAGIRDWEIIKTTKNKNFLL